MEHIKEALLVIKSHYLSQKVLLQIVLIYFLSDSENFQAYNKRI